MEEITTVLVPIIVTLLTVYLIRNQRRKAKAAMEVRENIKHYNDVLAPKDILITESQTSMSRAPSGAYFEIRRYGRVLAHYVTPEEVLELVRAARDGEEIDVESLADSP